MKHLGDISKIDASQIEPVWCITGGSPCQDLSIAGRRAGLAGARSGLYMEQIRIVKEMREHDRSIGRTGELVRPRYMVWENVPGAFSSNFKDGFGDFGAVLEEAVRIAEPGFSLPRLPGKQKWTKSGGIIGDGWSVAWRTHDAQYWGVPQRRRRISMVVDFNGHTAGDILFERIGAAECSSGDETIADSGRKSRPEIQPDSESMRGNPTESGETRETAPGGSESGSAYAVRIRGGCDGGGKGALVQTDKSGTLKHDNDQAIFCLQGNAIDRADTANCNGKGWKEDISYTLNTIDRPAVCAGFKGGQGEKAGGIGYSEEVSPTLSAAPSGSNQVPNVMAFDTTQICSRENGSIPAYGKPCHSLNSHAHVPSVVLDMTHACDVIRDCGDISPSLQARRGTGGNQIPMTYSLQRTDSYRHSEVGSTCSARDFKSATDLVISIDDEKNAYIDQFGTLKAHASGGTQQHVMERMVVRRLTPLECERLQGYEDGWTDIGEWTDSKGKKHRPADAPRYKALGNSVALPFWRWMFERMAAYLPESATLGSLFDGIGGFPLCWESIHGAGTARWASEIEEFPIAVTKLHFGGTR